MPPTTTYTAQIRLALWRYLVPKAGGRVGVVGTLDPAQRDALASVFDTVAEASGDEAWDGVLILPGHRTPGWVEAHAQRGGWVVEIGGARDGHRAGAIGYGVYPSLDEPRFILPLDALQGGLALYTPTRSPIQLGLKLVRGTALHHALRLIGGRIWVSAPSGMVADGHHLAISTGTVSAFHKGALLEMDAQGQAVAYGKLSASALVQSLIQTESDSLRALETLGPTGFDIPKRLGDIAWGNERGFWQSGPDEEGPPWQHGLSPALANGLGQLFQQSRHEQTMETTAFWQDLVRWHEAAIPHLDTRWTERMATLRARCEDDITESMVVGRAHGDFIAWNVKGDADRVFLFDWEQSMADAPPFFDLLHWLVFTHCHIDGVSGPVWPLLERGGEYTRARAQLEVVLGMECTGLHLRLFALRSLCYHLQAWVPAYEANREQHAATLDVLWRVAEEAMAL